MLGNGCFLYSCSGLENMFSWPEIKNVIGGVMKKIELAKFQHGAVSELFDEEFSKVLQNIEDENTIANKPRSITIKMEIKPDKKRRTGEVKVSVSSTLAKVKPAESFLFFDRDERGKFSAYEDNDTPTLPGIYVLSYASRLVGGTAIDGDDDGITQTVSVKRGLSGALKDQVALKPIVKLSPYRTFREVKQPESEFLLRVRLDQNDVPTVALFEADGGAWSNTAAENIVEYIQSIVTTIPVIA